MKKKIGILSGIVILVILLAAAVCMLHNPFPGKSRAEKLAESMTLEEKVGQMFLFSVSEGTADSQIISQYHPGGFLFFADFFQPRTKETAASDIASFQEASSVPMFMATDEEGGTVTRISRFPAYRKKAFSSPGELYNKGGLDAVLQDTKEKDQLLLSLGINVNLAPVCDMTEDLEAFIYRRTLGRDKETTSQYIEAVVKAMREDKIGSALKHFPGYGGNADTHTGIASDTRSLEDFTSCDFLPFQAGIHAGAPCVMVSHNIVASMDPERPASLSPEVHRILREDLGFKGVIMTDDLSMDGVQDYIDDEDMAVAAIGAGNDLLCSSQYKTQIPAVIQAVKEGKLSEEQITKSVIRILNWKEELGLLQ